jgi:nicotinamide-nucleotide amidase
VTGSVAVITLTIQADQARPIRDGDDDMKDLAAMGTRAGELLRQRRERVSVMESSAGGLVSAALLAVPGASRYFIGGSVIYTAEAREAILGFSMDDMDAQGLRSSSEPYAQVMAERVRAVHGTPWGLAETGAAGPTGNRYGDAAGHTCLAVSGPVSLVRTLETADDDRTTNMWLFADAALALLVEALESA